jgi:hypothetical protein
MIPIVLIKEPQKRQSREKVLIDDILCYLRTLGILAWRQNTGAMKIQNRLVRFGIHGMSDIIGILPDGRFLAIEVKTGNNRPTLYQKDFLNRIKDNNGVAIVAYSVEDVEKVLQQTIPSVLKNSALRKIS